MICQRCSGEVCPKCGAPSVDVTTYSDSVLKFVCTVCSHWYDGGPTLTEQIEAEKPEVSARLGPPMPRLTR